MRVIRISNALVELGLAVECGESHEIRAAEWRPHCRQSHAGLCMRTRGAPWLTRSVAVVAAIEGERIAGQQAAQ